MRVQINDKWVNIPSSLSEITIGQRIDFQQQYGNQLDEMLNSIFEMPDDYDREMELLEFKMEKMFRTFAFFAGTSVEDLKESSFINEINNIYKSTLAILFEEEENIELQHEFVWNNEKWELHSTDLKNGDKMKFGELIDAKQIVKDMIELGANRWEYMLPLCVIYLRKPGEDYEESFLFEGSDRMELMKTLPLDIALQVGFFLLSIQNTYLSTFQSSGQQNSKQQASIQRSILRNSVG